MTLAFLSLNLAVLDFKRVTSAGEWEWSFPPYTGAPPSFLHASIFSAHAEPPRSLRSCGKLGMLSPSSRSSALSSSMSSRTSLESAPPPPPPPPASLLFLSGEADFLSPSFFDDFLPLSVPFFLAPSSLGAALGSAASKIFLWIIFSPLSLPSRNTFSAFATFPSLPDDSLSSFASSAIIISTVAAFTLGSEILVRESVPRLIKNSSSDLLRDAPSTATAREQKLSTPTMVCGGITLPF
mmetsp:Transcript_53159/g.91307  ORF Transcript_53159/g.91307 Transcript_53159/m.91307 type:complete len:239 (-) Transcript_53159:144-860(-)